MIETCVDIKTEKVRFDRSESQVGLPQHATARSEAISGRMRYCDKHVRRKLYDLDNTLRQTGMILDRTTCDRHT